MTQTDIPARTHYDVLQIHPAAPLDLITAAYWRLVGQAQEKRAADPAAEATLHYLTRAYQTLADSAVRSQYDASLGIAPQAPAPVIPTRPRGLLGRAFQRDKGKPQIDYYEVLRVSPDAEPSILAEAFAVLRGYYLRLVNTGQARPEVVDALEEAYKVTSDPRSRRIYDDERARWLEHQRLFGQDPRSNGRTSAVPPVPGPLVRSDAPVSRDSAVTPSPSPLLGDRNGGAVERASLPVPATSRKGKGSDSTRLDPLTGTPLRGRTETSKAAAEPAFAAELPASPEESGVAGQEPVDRAPDRGNSSTGLLELEERPASVDEAPSASGRTETAEVDGAAEEPEAAEDRALPRDTLLLDHTSLPDDYLASSFEQMASPVMRTMDETEVVIDRSAGGSLWPSQSFDSPEVETLPVADPDAFDIPASPGIEPPDDSAADDLPVASVVDGAVSAGEGGEEPPEVDAQAQAGLETSQAIPGEGKKAGLIETLAHLPDRVLHGEESLEEALLRRLSSTTIHAFDGEVQNLRATILVKGGFEGESTHRFDQFPITLGSGISCDVVLSDLRPRHARVLYRDGRFVLYNLIGADDPSEHWAVVEDGDEIRLGPYRLRFLAETA